MSQQMHDAVFVERRFDLDNHEVIARFYTPVLAPGGEYQCRWRIEWPGREQGREQERYACGIDAVQALMLAMRVVHTKLMETEEYQSGALTYLDQQDLDLPPTWGSAFLYQAGTTVG